MAKQPAQFEVQPVLGLYNSGKLAEAEVAAKKLISQYPETFILYQVLGLAQDGLNKFDEAVDSYQKALALSLIHI